MIGSQLLYSFVFTQFLNFHDFICDFIQKWEGNTAGICIDGINVRRLNICHQKYRNTLPLYYLYCPLVLFSTKSTEVFFLFTKFLLNIGLVSFKNLFFLIYEIYQTFFCIFQVNNIKSQVTRSLQPPLYYNYSWRREKTPREENMDHSMSMHGYRRCTMTSSKIIFFLVTAFFSVLFCSPASSQYTGRSIVWKKKIITKISILNLFSYVSINRI